MQKITTHVIRQAKGKRRITALTAYDTMTARLVAEAGTDIVLVGDSVGTTVLGFSSTVPVTVDMIVHHTAAVARAGGASLLVADVPFGESQRDFDPLMLTCRRLMQEGGAEAVKLEGGLAIAPVVERLVASGCPVMGHIGLQPQQVHQLGGYRRFGKNADEAERLLADARALAEAGVFAIVLEMVKPEVAATITAAVSVPTIGIGSGPECDGQILVCNDVLGYTPGKAPSFAKPYADLKTTVAEAFKRFNQEVREGRYPS